jgi:hypothetical protein
MIEVYGAPIADADVPKIVEYLATTYLGRRTARTRPHLKCATHIKLPPSPWTHATAH